MIKAKLMGRFLAIMLGLILWSSVSAQGLTFDEDEVKRQDMLIQAITLKTLGKMDKAIELLTKLYREDRSNDAAAFELARCYLAEKDELKANDFLSKAITLQPENIWYQLYKAEMLENKNDIQGLVKIYQSLTTLQPQNTEFLHQLARYQEANGGYKDAIASLQKIENIRGISEAVSRDKYQLYRNLNDTKKAELELLQLVNTDPNNTRFLNNLASFYSQTGDEKKAKEIYRKVLSMDSDDPTANIALASEGNENDQKKAFLLSIQNVISNKDVNIDVKIKELIPFIQDLGQEGDAAQTLEPLLQSLQNVHPTEAKAYAIYGDYYTMTGKPEKAVAKYEKTVSLDPNVFSVWEGLMLSLVEMEDYKKLDKVSTEASTYFPYQSLCTYYNALSHIRMTPEELFMQGLKPGDGIKNSISSLEEIKAFNTKNKELTYAILKLQAEAYFKINDYKEGVDKCKEALTMNEAGDAELFEIYGDLLAATGDATRAVSLWKQAIGMGGDQAILESKIQTQSQK